MCVCSSSAVAAGNESSEVGPRKKERRRTFFPPSSLFRCYRPIVSSSSPPSLFLLSLTSSSAGGALASFFLPPFPSSCLELRASGSHKHPIYSFFANNPSSSSSLSHSVSSSAFYFFSPFPLYFPAALPSLVGPSVRLRRETEIELGGGRAYCLGLPGSLLSPRRPSVRPPAPSSPTGFLPPDERTEALSPPTPPKLREGSEDRWGVSRRRRDRRPLCYMRGRVGSSPGGDLIGGG